MTTTEKAPTKRDWSLRKDELRALNYMQHLYIDHGKVAIKPEVFQRIRKLIETGEAEL